MEKSTKDYIGAGLTAIALFGLIAFGLPYFNNIKNLRAEIETRNKIVSERQEILNNINQLKENFAAEQETISKVTAIVPENKSLPEIISSITTVAPQSGLILNNVSVTNGQDSDEQSYKTMILKLGLKGEYAGLISFLGQIEKNLRLINVTSANISTDSSQEGGLMNFDITAEAYFLK